MIFCFKVCHHIFFSMFPLLFERFFSATQFLTQGFNITIDSLNYSFSLLPTSSQTRIKADLFKSLVLDRFLIGIYFQILLNFWISRFTQSRSKYLKFMGSVCDILMVISLNRITISLSFLLISYPPVFCYFILLPSHSSTSSFSLHSLLY